MASSAKSKKATPSKAVKAKIPNQVQSKSPASTAILPQEKGAVEKAISTFITTFNSKAKKDTNLQKATECVIYTRVSTKEQAENNTSLESQKKACEAYAKKHELPIACYFGGTYESAKTDERKEFKRMIDFVTKSKGRIGSIIVYSVDRFSRSGAESINIADQLKKMGIILHSVTQPVDTTTSAGSLQQNIQMIFSQYDNEQRREKCMTGTKEKLRKGYRVGKAPFGYDQYTKNGEQQIEINEEGKWLKKAFEWKGIEGVSSAEILLRLRAKGIRLYAQHLSRIFRNPFYCGYIVNAMLEGEVIKGRHKPLISEELFLRVNGVLSSNAQSWKHEKENVEVPLKRFAKCASCGTSMVGYLVKKKNLHYYKCNTKGCGCNRSAKAMHELFEKMLSEYVIDRRLIPALKLQLRLTFEKMNKESLENTKLLNEGLKELEKKMERLEERYIEEEIDKAMFVKFKEKYAEEKLKLEAELKKVDHKLSNLSEYIEKSLVIASQLDSLWNKIDFQLKEKVQYLLFPEGVLYDRKNDEYRTSRINSIFLLIRSLSEENQKKEKGQTNNTIDLSPLVEGEGLEPLL